MTVELKTRAGRLSAALMAVVAFAVAVAILQSGPQAAWAASSTSKGLTAGTQAQSTVSATKAKKEKPAKSAFKTNTARLNVDSSTGWLVPNGTYYFALAKDASKVVGSNGRIQNKQGAKSQAWKIAFDYNTQCYTITNMKSGKVLASPKVIKKNAKLSEAKLVLKDQELTKWEGVPSYNVPIPSQRWKLKSDRYGYYLVSAVNTDYVVDLSGSRAHLAKKGKRQWTRYFWFVGRTGTFKQNGIGDGYYTLKSQSTGGILNIANSSVKKKASARVGKGLTIWGQVFQLAHAKNGYYKIANFNSGLALTDWDGRVRQCETTKKVAKYQLWKPVIVGSNGAVQLKNCKTGRVLAVKGGIAVTVKASATDTSQRWLINPTSTGLTTVGRLALRKANKATTSKPNIIVIDMTAHEYFLFHKAKKANKGAPWYLEDTSRCSTGRDGHSTWAGTATTRDYQKHRSGMPATWTIDVTRGSWIHSIVNYGPQGENQLGWNISAACIRLPKRQAEYVFNHTTSGTTIIRYY